MSKVRVGKVEMYDVSAVAFALLGTGYDVTFESATTVAWLDVYVQTWSDDHADRIERAKDIITRAIGVSNRTPMIEIKKMAECCGLGHYCTEIEPVCDRCNSHLTPRKTGEPPWRLPKES